MVYSLVTLQLKTGLKITYNLGMINDNTHTHTHLCQTHSIKTYDV